jgi:hypothetical protein
MQDCNPTDSAIACGNAPRGLHGAAFRRVEIGLVLALFAALSAGAAPKNACLLTAAEFVKLAGGNPMFPPEEVQQGTLCAYENGTIYLYSGKDARGRWDAQMKTPVLRDAKRVPVSGVGDGAYALFVDPPRSNQVGAAFVVFSKGPHVVAVSINPPQGKRAETVREQVVSAAKLAASRLD